MSTKKKASKKKADPGTEAMEQPAKPRPRVRLVLNESRRIGETVCGAGLVLALLELTPQVTVRDLNLAFNAGQVSAVQG